MKRNCLECKNCFYKKMLYTDGYATACACEDKISELSMEELEECIKNGTCKFYELGTPAKRG